jgi:hypothetical protein
VKKVHSLVAVAALIAGLATSLPAQAATTITGGPYTGLNPAGATITLTMTNVPTTGMYIQQCQITALGSLANRPTTAQCNAAAQLWITDSGQGNFKFSDTITVNVRESFGAISCNTVGCGLFFRLDHTAPTNISEDRFIPIQFTGGAPLPLPSDEITVKIGTTTLTPNRPSTLAYRAPVTLTATTLSGAKVTAKSLGANCSVDANLVVTALKGTGECVIAVTSPGTTTYATATNNYPFTLALGTQTLTLTLPTSVKVSKAIVLAPTTLTTSLGEKVKITATPANFCTITSVKKSIKLMAKKPGTCTLTVTAAARNGLYTAYKSTSTVTVTK